MNVQWLLIGGPAHGTTVWAKAGSSLRTPCGDGADVLYVGHDYLFHGDLYRVGCVNEKDAETVNVERLIMETKLQPVGGRVR